MRRRHHDCRRHGPMRRYLGARLHRRLFMLLGASIVTTAVVVGALGLLTTGHGPRSYHRSLHQTEQLVGEQFAEVWGDPARRAHLARRLHEAIGMSIALHSASGEALERYGPDCAHADYQVDVKRDGATLGRVVACGEHRGNGTFVVVLLVLGVTLWGSAGMIARRLVRPLGEVAEVANAIGAGKLDSRVRTGRRHQGEVAVLADAINNMADRIEQQMADQRELLAGVSHEIRSPLARMRVLLELARPKSDDAGALDEIEREVLEIDELVGELLASARLDFAALDKRALDAVELATRALERAGLPATLLTADAGAKLEADPTLLARALANLLDNAARHGGGATSLAVETDERELRFVVADAGPGIAENDLPHVFESFVRGERGGASSLGLGLALVRRIANAHGGRAFAENGQAGGARVGFSVATTRPPPG